MVSVYRCDGWSWTMRHTRWLCCLDFFSLLWLTIERNKRAEPVAATLLAMIPRPSLRPSRRHVHACALTDFLPVSSYDRLFIALSLLLQHLLPFSETRLPAPLGEILVTSEWKGNWLAEIRVVNFTVVADGRARFACQERRSSSSVDFLFG